MSWNVWSSLKTISKGSKEVVMWFLEVGRAERFGVTSESSPNVPHPQHTGKKTRSEVNPQQIYTPPPRPCPPTPLYQGCQNLHCAPDWLWQELKNPLYVRSCSPVQGEVGEKKKKCLQDRFSLKPRARLDLRPPLSYYTALSQFPRSVWTASSPADSRRGSRGPRASPARSAQGSDLRGPTTGRGGPDPSPLGLVHIVPTYSESPRPAPAVPARASESRGLDLKQTNLPPRRRAQEGRGYGETRPRRSLARSLRDPSALLKFSRESSSRGLRKAFSIFTFLFFPPCFGSFNWYFGPEGGASLKKETGWGEQGLGTAGFAVWANLRKELHWSQSQTSVWGPRLSLSFLG